MDFYCSTRGRAVSGGTLEETLFSGFLSDGGLFIPRKMPSLDGDTWKSWRNLTYPQIVAKLLVLFTAQDEIPANDIENITTSAFKCFRHPEVVALKELDQKTSIAELFHGPTLTFKDLAMSLIKQLLEFYLAKRQKRIIILVGTSGDTGSAAIECVRGSRWIDIVVLYPKGRCTVLQELQMTTVLEDNVHMLAVDGTSDELDEPIKACFSDPEFVANHNLCSINSINWVRIAVQVAHYFYIYFRLVPKCEETVQFVLPTGACGNLTSGVVAKLLGLPIRLVATVNANSVIHESLTEGVLEVSPTLQTLAPAMDIQVPYNFERLIYLATNGNHSQVKKIMIEFEEKQSVKIPSDVLKQLQQLFTTTTVHDPSILAAMKKCWDENNYLVDPHTAVALAYHYSCGPSMRRVCVATASPEKFPEAVKKAGIDTELKFLTFLTGLPTRFERLVTGRWENQLRKKIEDITSMRKAVS